MRTYFINYIHPTTKKINAEKRNYEVFQLGLKPWRIFQPPREKGHLVEGYKFQMTKDISLKQRGPRESLG